MLFGWIHVLAALAMAPARDVSVPVRFAMAATPLRKALPALAAQTHVAFDASPEMKDEIIVLSVKNVPLNIVMDKMAAAMDADWQPMEGGFRLYRSAAHQRALRQAAMQATTDAIAKSMSDLRAQLEKEASFDALVANSLALQLQDLQKRGNSNPLSPFDGASSDQRTRVKQRGPAGRALRRMVLLLDPAVLAAGPISGRVVYSTSPNKMQRPVPGGFDKVVAQFVVEQGVWNEALQKVMGDPSARGSAENDPNQTPLTERPAKAILVVSNYEFGSGINIKLMVGDKRGRLLANGSLNLSNQPARDQAVPPKPPVQPEEELAFSSITQAFIARMRQRTVSQAGFPVLDGDVRVLLDNPEQRDPLSFIASEGLLGVGERRHENVVASMPDMAFYATLVMAGGKITPTSFLQTMDSLQERIDEGGGWLMAKPRRRLLDRSINASRPAIGKVMRTMHAKGSLPLADAMEYAATNLGREPDLLLMMLLMVTEPQSMQSLSMNWDALSLYGLMSPTQHKMLESGQAIPFRMFSKDQRRVVERMVFGLNETLRVRDVPAGGGRGVEWNQEDFDVFWSGMYHQPTESLPNGLPDDGELTATFARSDMLFVDGLGRQPQTPGQLALQVFAAEHPDQYPEAAKVSVDKLRCGERLTIKFDFAFTERLYMETSIQSYEMAPGEPSAPDKLPEPYRTQFNEAMANIKKQHPPGE